jgi:hypothetical protein
MHGKIVKELACCPLGLSSIYTIVTALNLLFAALLPIFSVLVPLGQNLIQKVLIFAVVLIIPVHWIVFAFPHLALFHTLLRSDQCTIVNSLRKQKRVLNLRALI